MDMSMMKRLAVLSGLEFSEEELERAAVEMGDIIGLMDSVRECDVPCGESRGEAAALESLRADEVCEPMPQERITANAVIRDGAFVVPKVVE